MTMKPLYLHQIGQREPRLLQTIARAKKTHASGATYDLFNRWGNGNLITTCVLDGDK